LQRILALQAQTAAFDVSSVETVQPHPRGRARAGTPRIPHRLARCRDHPFDMHVAIPRGASTNSRSTRYLQAGLERLAAPGIVGDGDKFREPQGKREIGASHFDSGWTSMATGDLDLFKGALTFVDALENVAANRLVDRGPTLLTWRSVHPPKGRSNRSW